MRLVGAIVPFGGEVLILSRLHGNASVDGAVHLHHWTSTRFGRMACATHCD